MKAHKFIVQVCVLLMSLLIIPAHAYDVATPHLIINQVLGGSGGWVSHNFIELYNPTS